MKALSAGQGKALANLGRKKAGEAVGWINIADARALADLGLAMRTPAGWTLTPAGVARLAEEETCPAEEPQPNILKFANDEEPTNHGRI